LPPLTFSKTAQEPAFCPAPINPILYALEDNEGWHTSLKSEGYAVIENILPDEAREELLNLFYENLFTAAKQSEDASLRNMKITDRESWLLPDQLGRKSRHAPLHIAQSDFMWSLRTQPQFRHVFSHVHEVDPKDLCVSLDSYSLQMRGHPSVGLCLHDDQAWGLDDRSEHYSIQGAYNFYSCSAEDTGLIVVPGSHQRWSKRRAGTVGSRHKQHFVPITSDEEEYARAYNNARKLLLPKNCFVIWNSKLLHGTSLGSRERPNDIKLARPRVNRLTCFISMAPKYLRSQESLAAKINIYKLGGTTSHWSTHGFTHVLNEAGLIRGTLTESGDIPPDRMELL
jgi:ectoine hydroxylase-related dioxygenase (phytanoyl-CoA dioxygenase family)